MLWYDILGNGYEVNYRSDYDGEYPPLNTNQSEFFSLPYILICISLCIFFIDICNVLLLLIFFLRIKESFVV